MSLINKTNKILLYIFLSMIPILTLILVGSGDPFTHAHLANIANYQLNQKISHYDIEGAYSPFYSIIIIIINDLCKLPLELIQYIPITGIGFALVCPVLIKKFLPLNISLISSLIIIVSFVAPNNYSIWPHAFGYILFMVFIMMYINYTNDKNPKVGILLIILFVGIHFYSYTSELWTISFIFFTTAFFAINKEEKKTTASLLLICIILFIGFNKVVMGSYIPSLETFLDNSNMADGFFNIFSSNNVPESPYTYSANFDILTTALGFVRILLYTLPFIIIFPLIIKNIIRDRSLKIVNRATFVYTTSVLLVTIPDSIAYYTNGAPLIMSLFKYFFLIAPFISLYVLSIITNRERKNVKLSNKLVITYGIIILLISSSLLIINIENKNFSQSDVHYSNIDSIVHWSNSNQITGFVSDYHTIGRVQLIEATNGMIVVKYVDAFYFDDSFYFLIDNEMDLKNIFKNKLIIINIHTGDQKIMADNWNNLEPMDGYYNKINNNNYINKIYDKGSVVGYV